MVTMFYDATNELYAQNKHVLTSPYSVEKIAIFDKKSSFPDHSWENIVWLEF